MKQFRILVRGRSLGFILIASLLLNWPIAWLISANPLYLAPQFAPLASTSCWPSWTPKRWPSLSSFISRGQSSKYETLIGKPAADTIQIPPLGEEVQYATRTTARTIGITCDTIQAAIQTTVTPYEFFVCQECDIGVPFHAIRQRISVDTTGSSRADFNTGDLWPSRSTSLPLRPIVGGVLLNTMVYFVIIYSLSHSLHVVVMRGRIRHGQCMCCGYDIRGMRRCPECDQPVE